ncbi:hypothetical protein GGS26DRAFT_588236 [Hypomontagnella submonticulosa]|nr:hypothetical protein GGS26DRAFT_588236 [Hypomontagnella submonticulosa]
MSVTTMAAVTPRNICENCKEEIPTSSSMIPEIVLRLDDPEGWRTESQRQCAVVCADCYLSTEYTTRCALYAVAVAPDLVVHSQLRDFVKQVVKRYWPTRPWRHISQGVDTLTEDTLMKGFEPAPFDPELYGEGSRVLYEEYVELSKKGVVNLLEREDFSLFRQNRVLDNIYRTLTAAIHYCRHKIQLSDIIADITELKGADKALDFLVDLGEYAWNDVMAEKFTLGATEDEFLIGEEPGDLFVAKANGVLNAGYIESLWQTLEQAIADTRVRCYMREEAEGESASDSEPFDDTDDVRRKFESAVRVSET